MSLKIWLPLNGDILDRGLSNVTVINSGATINNNGKIGKCYYFTGNQMSFPAPSWACMLPANNFSLFCWVKGASASSWLFAEGAWEARFRPTQIGVSISNNGLYPAFASGTYSETTWYHFGFTWEGATGKLRTYLDGVEVASSTVPSSAIYQIGSTFKMTYSSGYYLNDFRIYDHCLSASEVYELSLGLCLHYTLNNPYIDTATSVPDDSGFGHDGTIIGSLVAAQDSGRYSYSTYFENNTRKIQASFVLNGATELTMSVWIKSSNTSPTGGYHEPLNISGTAAEFSISSDGKFRHGFVIGSRRYADTTNSKNVLDGKWHHLCATYDGATIRRYVDGAPVSGADRSVTGVIQNLTKLFVGTLDTFTNYGNKQIYESDIRIYVTALSADDVKKLYNLGMKVDNKQNIHSLMFDEMSNNLINRSACTGGIILSNGAIQTHNSWYVTDYIPVTYGKNYLAVGLTTANSGNVYNAFYDSSKTLTRTVLDTTDFEQEITPASGEAYVRLSIRNGSKEFATAGLYEVVNRKILQTGIIGSVLYNEETKAAIYKHGSIHAKEFIEI